MKCPRCQVENDAVARFCEDCGARLRQPARAVAPPSRQARSFCRSCGAALTAEPAGRFASPDSYTPKHLAERILTSKAALEGERKQVTVLFADLKGSMRSPSGEHECSRSAAEMRAGESSGRLGRTVSAWPRCKGSRRHRSEGGSWQSRVRRRVAVATFWL